MGLSPMMQHYLQTKENFKDCILFYRLGDFYEMFFDDAIKVSNLLDLTLTGVSLLTTVQDLWLRISNSLITDNAVSITIC